LLERHEKNPLLSRPTLERFPNFADKSTYSGLVPGGAYLEAVYKAHAALIDRFLAAEVKKRGAERLHWDASFKEAKHLCQIRGKPMFKALITATNQVGEVRMQFHVVTDGHDQFDRAIDDMLHTLNAFGQPGPELFATDKPAEDKSYFLNKIPSLQAKQDQLDRNAPLPPPPPSNFATLDKSKIQVAKTVTAIETAVQSVRDLLGALPAERRVVALDAEWDTTKNAAGHVVGQGKVALIQLGYDLDDGEGPQALLLQVARLSKLPERLEKFIVDAGFTFVGRGVGADFEKIAKDFKSPRVKAFKDEGGGVVDLGTLARSRGLAKVGTLSLEKVVRLTVGKDVSKDPLVRLSQWSTPTLTQPQMQYAALDVTLPLEAYYKMIAMSDLEARLSAADARAGAVADLVPSHGRKSQMATRAATVVILEANDGGSAYWETPEGYTPSRLKVSAKMRLVRVTAVHAPNFTVSRVKKKGGKGNNTPLSLGDLGSPPFVVAVPLAALAPHVASATSECADEAPSTTSATPAGTATTSGVSRMRTSTHNEPLEHDAEIYEESGEDGDYGEIDEHDVELVRAALAAVDDAAQASPTTSATTPLDEAPARIHDHFSAVLGDVFHLMDRPKVPVRHHAKKPYFVSMRDAWFLFDVNKLAEVLATLKAEGKTDEDIEAMMYYNFAYFRERVPRVVPPPSILYKRVRKVYELFGPMKDPETGNPLFNAQVRKQGFILEFRDFFIFFL
jgi:hypothetical protein